MDQVDKSRVNEVPPSEMNNDLKWTNMGLKQGLVVSPVLHKNASSILHDNEQKFGDVWADDQQLVKK